MAEHQEYDDHTDQSGVEDAATEFESALSSDEADDQGLEEDEVMDESEYIHYPDYVDVEERPLCLRVLSKVGRSRELRIVPDNVDPQPQRSASDAVSDAEALVPQQAEAVEPAEPLEEAQAPQTAAPDLAVAGHSRNPEFAMPSSSRDPQFRGCF